MTQGIKPGLGLSKVRALLMTMVFLLSVVFGFAPAISQPQSVRHWMTPNLMVLRMGPFLKGPQGQFHQQGPTGGETLSGAECRQGGQQEVIGTVLSQGSLQTRFTAHRVDVGVQQSSPKRETE